MFPSKVQELRTQLEMVGEVLKDLINSEENEHCACGYAGCTESIERWERARNVLAKLHLKEKP